MDDMIDKNKTDFLRKKIQGIKEESVKEGIKESKKEQLQNLLSFFLKYLVFYGAQYYILVRTDYPPFGAWESLVILMAVGSFLSIIKNTEK